MLAFAFLLPFLTWEEAAGCAALALVFNTLILPRLGVDLSKAAVNSAAASAIGEAPVSAHGMWTGIVLYPVSVLALILLFPHHLEVVAAAWAMMALGDALAGIAGEAIASPALAWNTRKSWVGFAAFIAAGTFGATVLIRWTAPWLAPERALAVCAAAAVVGAIAESLPIRLDDNLTVPLICGAFLFCALHVGRAALASNEPYLATRLAVALGVNLIFALAALALKTASRSGAAMGFFLGVLVYLGYGYKSFAVLLAFFVLGSVVTRLGYAKKAARGISEKRGGARGWREAAANLLVGAFCAVLVITTHCEKIFLVALVAAFSEAAGDTTSSEIGQWLSTRAYLITNFRPVAAGEDGGMTLAGTLAGFVSSALVAASGLAVGLVSVEGAAAALAAGFAGNLFDSFLGATLERRGLVTNGIVNFAGTGFAAALAGVIAFHLHL